MRSHVKPSSSRTIQEYRSFLRDLSERTGTCRSCPQKAEKNRVYCLLHLERSRKRAASMKSSSRRMGLCLYCHKSKSVNGLTTCEPCRVRRRKYEAEYKKKHRPLLRTKDRKRRENTPIGYCVVCLAESGRARKCEYHADLDRGRNQRYRDKVKARKLAGKLTGHGIDSSHKENHHGQTEVSDHRIRQGDQG